MAYNTLKGKVNFSNTTTGSIESMVDDYSNQAVAGVKTFSDTVSASTFWDTTTDSQVGTGTGNVTGVDSANDRSLIVADGTSGKAITGSNVTMDPAGNINAPGQTFTVDKLAAGGSGVTSTGDISGSNDFIAHRDIMSNRDITAVRDIKATNDLSASNDVLSGRAFSGSSLYLDKDYTATAAETIYAAQIDFDKTGNSTSNNTIYGLNIDMDNTTATNGVNSMYGIYCTPTLTHAADAGTPVVWGAFVSASGGTNGTGIATGAKFAAGGADLNYGVIIDCEDGGTDLRIESSADSSDYFQIQTTAAGATTITTVDDAAAAANLTFNVDGDITLDPVGGNVVIDGNLSASVNISGSSLYLDNDIVLGDDQQIYFEDDLGTYIESDTADRLRFVVGSNQMLLLDEDEDRVNIGYGNKLGVGLGNNDTPSASLHISGSGRDGYPLFQVTSDGGAGSLFVSASGKVGIGTIAPDYDLDVAGTVGIANYIYHNGDEDTYLLFQNNLVNLVAGGKSAIKLDTSAEKIQLNNTNEDLDVQMMADNGAVILHTDAATNMVGINTDSPSHALTVVGGISASSTLHVEGAATFSSTIAATSSVTAVGLYSTGPISGSTTLHAEGAATFSSTLKTTGSIVSYGGIRVSGSSYNYTLRDDSGNNTDLWKADINSGHGRVRVRDSGNTVRVVLDGNGGVVSGSGTATLGAVETTGHSTFDTGITLKNADASAGYINFYEQSSNGTNVCTFRGKSSMGNCTITLPGDTGTVVLEDNTVTLSNKTIASPIFTGAVSSSGPISASSTLHIEGAATFSSTVAVTSSVTAAGIVSTTTVSASTEVAGQSAKFATLHISGSETEGIRVAKGASDTREIVFENDGNDVASIFMNAAETLIIKNESTNDDIQFQTSPGGTARTVMVVDGATPNVGIGTIAPLTALDVRYDVTGSLSDDTGGGEVVFFGTGTLTAGKLYFLHTDSAWTETDADAVATGADQLLGIALGANPVVNGVLIRGFFDQATHLSNFSAGKAIYVSTTAATTDTTAPSATGDFVRIVGYCTTTANVIYFNPSSEWIELA